MTVSQKRMTSALTLALCDLGDGIGIPTAVTGIVKLIASYAIARPAVSGLGGLFKEERIPGVGEEHPIYPSRVVWKGGDSKSDTLLFIDFANQRICSYNMKSGAMKHSLSVSPSLLLSSF